MKIYKFFLSIVATILAIKILLDVNWKNPTASDWYFIIIYFICLLLVMFLLGASIVKNKK